MISQNKLQWGIDNAWKNCLMLFIWNSCQSAWRRDITHNKSSELYANVMKEFVCGHVCKSCNFNKEINGSKTFYFKRYELALSSWSNWYAVTAWMLTADLSWTLICIHSLMLTADLSWTTGCQVAENDKKWHCLLEKWLKFRHLIVSLWWNEGKWNWYSVIGHWYLILHISNHYVFHKWAGLSK